MLDPWTRRTIAGFFVGSILIAGCDDGAGDGAGGSAAGGDGGTGGEAGGGGAPPAPLVWEACDTSEWPLGYPYPAAGVECTTIHVPLDHAAPDGPTYPIRVAIHRSKVHPSGKAVFNLAGGPGGAAISQSGIIPQIQPELLDDFDLVYVDQRGTGASGYLDCPGGYPEDAADWESCAEQLATLPEIAHFMTEDAAHDLDFVRTRLGYDKIHVRGGSYGTRSGLEYLRQYPDRIAAIVLDGLAPPDLDLFGEDVQSFDRGVAMLLADCAQDPSCLAVSPSLEEDLLAVRAARAASPHPITVDGQGYQEDEELFLIFLSNFLYLDSARFGVPAAIHAAALGDRAAWYALASSTFGLDIQDGATMSFTSEERRGPWRPPARSRLRARAQEYVSPGLFATIMCAEFFPNSGGVPALEAALAAQAWPSGSILDLAEACESWGIAPIDAALRQPVSSDVPVLLLSGEIDLNTLAEWGDRAKATLPSATHIVVPYTSHSTVRVECVNDVIVQYFRSGGAIGTVDTSCIEAIPHQGW
jgi:pimeloyl-ACP methyl ester carboxylesterase